MTRQEMEHRIAVLKDVIAIIENATSDDNPAFEVLELLHNGNTAKNAYRLALCGIEQQIEHLICELLQEGGI